MKKTLLLAFIMVIGEMCLAQQSHINLDWAPQKNLQGLVPFGANTISPEVHDDHTVTFRYKAPGATEVSLFGDIQRALKSEKPIPLTKDSDGIWTLTVGPVTPEIYYYRFSVDGALIIDPANTFVGFAGMPGFSILIVHGNGPAFYDAKDVPHGVVSRHIYHSDVTAGEREIYVYTPPGYDSKKKYPVLYLVGGSGEVAASWSLFGRINFIADNLIAEGKALPMIIAVPNNQVVHRMDPKHTEKTFSIFNNEMLKEVIPLVEKNYSVKTDKHNRAIAGLSMGGRHAQIVGLNNLNMFGSIGILSAAESMDKNPGVFDDPKLNDKIDYLFVGAGTNETTPTSRHVGFHQELEKRNVKHEYYIGSEGAHDFITWRHLLYYRFLPTLWRKQ